MEDGLFHLRNSADYDFVEDQGSGGLLDKVSASQPRDRPWFPNLTSRLFPESGLESDLNNLLELASQSS